jgi:transcriptional regulator with XRE-family HTH domain
MSETPTAHRVQLGRELADLRQRTGVSREDAVQALMCSLSKLSKIENGQLAPNELEVHTLLRLYRVPEDSDQAKRIKAIGAEARKRAPYRMPEYLRALVGFEATAVSIQAFEIDLVPGLFQTESYTRALARAANPGPGDVERLVAIRRERQSRLTGDNPPQLTVVIHEAALRVRVGDTPDVMSEQLDRLLELANLPNISLQVLPFSAGPHPSMGAPFSILRMPEGDRVVYLETLWMSDYVRRPAQVAAYSQVFESLCTSARDRENTVEMIKEIKGEL